MRTPSPADASTTPPATAECRAHHQHSAFKYWADTDRDSRNIRDETLKTETVIAPKHTPGSKPPNGQ